MSGTLSGPQGVRTATSLDQGGQLQNPVRSGLSSDSRLDAAVPNVPRTLEGAQSTLIAELQKRNEELENLHKQHQLELAEMRKGYKGWADRNQQMENELERIHKIIQQFESAEGVHVGIEASGPANLRLQELSAVQRETLELQRAQEAHMNAEMAKLVQENQRLKQEMMALRQSNQQLPVLAQTRQRLLANIAQLTGQITQAARDKNTLVTELQHLRAELKHKAEKHEHYRKQQEVTMHDFDRDRKQIRQQIQTFAQKEVELVAENEKLRTALESTEHNHQAVSRDLQATRGELEGMFRHQESINKELQDYKARASEVMNRDNEAAERVASAELERDQAIARDRRAEQTIQRLQASLVAANEDTQKRIDESVKRVYERGEQAKQQLLEDARNYQLALVDTEHKKAELARKVSSLESLLQQTKEGLEAERDGLARQLQQSLSVFTEKEIDNETLRAQAKRLEDLHTGHKSNWAREREILLSQAQEFRLEADNKTLEVQSIQQKYFAVEGERDSALKRLRQLQSDSQHAFADLQEKNRVEAVRRIMEMEDLKARLDEAYSLQEESEARLSDLLAAKEEQLAKWREDARDNLLHFQKVLTEQKDSIEGLSADNSSLQHQLVDLGSEKEHAVAQFKHQTELLEHFKQEAQDATSQIAPMRVQLTEAQHRCMQMDELCAKMRARLDRSTVECNRLKRQAESESRRWQFQQQADQIGRNGYDD